MFHVTFKRPYCSIEIIKVPTHAAALGIAAALVLLDESGYKHGEISISEQVRDVSAERKAELESRTVDALPDLDHGTFTLTT